MQENKQEKLPLDAKLLSEAVIELNISRRSVGLYPADHPILRESIDRAFSCLQKLFEIRSAITLGIAGDTLVVDEYKLDRKNPVFNEFATSLHSKGIAALTFTLGLTKEELIGVHELIAAKDMPICDLVEQAKRNNIVHIILSPLNFGSFRFVEGIQSKTGTDDDIWGDYIYGLLEGKLSTDDVRPSKLLDIPPEEVARVVNTAMAEDSSRESYDRVITSYLKSKEGSKLSSEAYNKFILFIDNLSPDLKSQFLSRSFSHVTENISEVEKMINDMTPDGFNRMARVLTEHSSVIPVTLKNLIDKLSSLKQSGIGNFDFFSQHTAVVDDVELGENMRKLFDEDHFKTYVSEDYQKELTSMLTQSSGNRKLRVEALIYECRDEVIDSTMLGVIIEIFDSDCVNDEDYLALLTRLSELTNDFIQTGRFDEILEVYNTLVSHSLYGRFKDKALSMREYFFHSEDFLVKFFDALRLWGRKDREGSLRLAKALKSSVIKPLLDSLMSEPDASMRKFILSVLENIGSDINPYVIKRLNDKRWFVIRNMLYLLRETDGRSYVSYIRKFAKHKNVSICIEALKTLLQFKTSDAIPLLKIYIQSENENLRIATVRLAGTYRIKEAVPYLINILEKKDLFGTESSFKIEAVRALAEIGDRSTVRTLLALYSARSLFYKGYLKDLKVEIFRTLESYPSDSIQDLLALGLRSDNGEIRSTSERLLAGSTTSGTGEMGK